MKEFTLRHAIAGALSGMLGTLGIMFMGYPLFVKLLNTIPDWLSIVVGFTGFIISASIFQIMLRDLPEDSHSLSNMNKGGKQGESNSV